MKQFKTMIWGAVAVMALSYLLENTIFKDAKSIQVASEDIH
jgi:hypothetical protein